MNVNLDLKPEIERRLTAEAAARGLAIGTYLASLLEGEVLLSGPKTATSEQFDADMDLMAEGSEWLPVLAPEAFSRESIYADHD